MPNAVERIINMKPITVRDLKVHLGGIRGDLPVSIYIQRRGELPVQLNATSVMHEVLCCSERFTIIHDVEDE